MAAAVRGGLRWAAAGARARGGRARGAGAPALGCSGAPKAPRAAGARGAGAGAGAGGAGLPGALAAEGGGGGGLLQRRGGVGLRGFAASGDGRSEEAGEEPDKGTEGGAAAPAGEDPAAEAEAGAEAGAEAEAEAPESEADAERAALERELDDTKDALLRVLADMENLRGRTAKQVETSQKFAVQGLVKSLLDVSDNLDRALGAVPPEMLRPELAEEDVARAPEMLRSLHEGVQMTGGGLQQAFKQSKVEKYEPAEGDEFDPNLHNALFEVPAPEGQPVGRVAVVTKAGFTLHDRVLRPAEVGVFK